MLKAALFMLPIAFVAVVASAHDDTSVQNGGTCSFVGTWTGSYTCPGLHGMPYTWVVHSDGTASGMIGNRIPIKQTWSMSGSTLTIHDVGGCTGAGTYTLSFDASCKGMKLKRQSDACAPRGSCVDGLTGARH